MSERNVVAATAHECTGLVPADKNGLNLVMGTRTEGDTLVPVAVQHYEDGGTKVLCSKLEAGVCLFSAGILSISKDTKKKANIACRFTSEREGEGEETSE